MRSRNAVKDADVVIFISDVQQGFAEELYDELLELNSEERIIKVANKVDLDPETKMKSDVFLSAKTGEGIEELFKTMKEKALGTQNYSEKTAVVSNLRHFNALEKAKEHLEIAKGSIDDHMTGEFISVDLRNAESALGEIIGKVTTDDILNNIFAKFCIGK